MNSNINFKIKYLLLAKKQVSDFLSSKLSNKIKSNFNNVRVIIILNRFLLMVVIALFSLDTRSGESL